MSAKYYVHCVRCTSKKYYSDSPDIMLDEFDRWMCKSCYLTDPLRLKERRLNFKPRTPPITQKSTVVYEGAPILWNTLVCNWEDIDDNWETLR